MPKEKLRKELIIHQSKTGAIELKSDFKHETIWATQKQIAELFSKGVPAVNEHIKNIYKEGELNKTATVRKFRIVQIEGTRKIRRKVELYNLDVILSVGYRVSSKQATQFRIWATKILREHITKGFTINPKVVKNNYAEFQKTIENIKHLLPDSSNFDQERVLELLKK